VFCLCQILYAFHSACVCYYYHERCRDLTLKIECDDLIMREEEMRKSVRCIGRYKTTLSSLWYAFLFE
jgi:hypothetical protein